MGGFASVVPGADAVLGSLRSRRIRCAQLELSGFVEVFLLNVLNDWCTEPDVVQQSSNVLFGRGGPLCLLQLGDPTIETLDALSETADGALSRGNASERGASMCLGWSRCGRGGCL